jgi:hypothetical protein
LPFAPLYYLRELSSFSCITVSFPIYLTHRRYGGKCSGSPNLIDPLYMFARVIRWFPKHVSEQTIVGSISYAAVACRGISRTENNRYPALPTFGNTSTTSMLARLGEITKYRLLHGSRSIFSPSKSLICCFLKFKLKRKSKDFVCLRLFSSEGFTRSCNTLGFFWSAKHRTKKQVGTWLSQQYFPDPGMLLGGTRTIHERASAATAFGSASSRTKEQAKAARVFGAKLGHDIDRSTNIVAFTDGSCLEGRATGAGTLLCFLFALLSSLRPRLYLCLRACLCLHLCLYLCLMRCLLLCVNSYVCASVVGAGGATNAGTVLISSVFFTLCSLFPSLHFLLSEFCSLLSALSSLVSAFLLSSI